MMRRSRRALLWILACAAVGAAPAQAWFPEDTYDDYAAGETSGGDGFTYGELGGGDPAAPAWSNAALFIAEPDPGAPPESFGGGGSGGEAAADPAPPAPEPAAPPAANDPPVEIPPPLPAPDPAPAPDAPAPSPVLADPPFADPVAPAPAPGEAPRAPEAPAAIPARAPQVISFAPPARAGFPGPPLVLEATATSGLPVTLARLSGAGTLEGNRLTLTGAGPVVVAASQPGDSAWLPAPDVVATIQAEASPAITRIRFNATGHDVHVVNQSAPIGSTFIWTDPAGLRLSPWPDFASPQPARPGPANLTLPPVPTASDGGAR